MPLEKERAAPSPCDGCQSSYGVIGGEAKEGGAFGSCKPEAGRVVPVLYACEKRYSLNSLYGGATIYIVCRERS